MLSVVPEVDTDGKIDLDKLKDILADKVEESPERYNFTWNGKKQAMKLAQQPSAATLKPNKEKSKNWDSTENLYIEGDNLEVLKLLQKSYSNKVKLIYVDPPYNTGKDFVYKDNFKDSIENYLEQTGQVDSEGNKLSVNTDTSGRYHTDWLNMMYPRLKLARNLLTEDGVIFISIDENEYRNLRALCDEIFGEINFVTTFVWEKKKKPSFLNANIGSKFEYILVFSKDRAKSKPFSVETTTEGKKYPFNNAGNTPTELVFPAQSVKFTRMTDQLVTKQNMSGGNIKTELLNDFAIENGTNSEEIRLFGEWRYSQETLNEFVSEGAEITISSIPFRPNLTKAGGEIKKMHNLLTIDQYNIDTNEDATEEFTNLVGGNYFDYTKPTKLIKMLIQSYTYDDTNAFILDFFSGSGTTAEAVMKMNEQDGGTRKFICVQLPEKLEEKEAAYKAGFRTIPEIAEKRIDLAGDKIVAENPLLADKLDIGFKVFELNKSNVKKWNSEAENIVEQLDFIENNFEPNSTPLDVVYEIMLKQGLDLTYSVVEHQVGSSTIYDIAYGAMFVVLGDAKESNVADFIIQKRNEHEAENSVVVFQDNKFVDDSEKLNTIEALNANGIQYDDILSI